MVISQNGAGHIDALGSATQPKMVIQKEPRHVYDNPPRENPVAECPSCVPDSNSAHLLLETVRLVCES